MLMTTQVVLAQDNFPSRPIRIIVPYTAGTGADVLSRILAQAMTPIWVSLSLWKIVLVLVACLALTSVQKRLPMVTR